MGCVNIVKHTPARSSSKTSAHNSTHKKKLSMKQLQDENTFLRKELDRVTGNNRMIAQNYQKLHAKYVREQQESKKQEEQFKQ